MNEERAKAKQDGAEQQREHRDRGAEALEAAAPTGSASSASSGSASSSSSGSASSASVGDVSVSRSGEGRGWEEDSGINNNDDGDGDEEEDPALAICLHPSIVKGPRITAEAELLELSRATDREIDLAHVDVYGLPRPGSCHIAQLRLERAAELTEAALSKIDPSKKRALLRAQLAFPFLFASHVNVRPFLEVEDYQPDRAAQRMVRYWDARERVLGDEAFSPDWFGTCTDEDMERLHSRGFKSAGDPEVDRALRAAIVKTLSAWMLGKIEATERELEGLPFGKNKAYLDAKRAIAMPDLVDEGQMVKFLAVEGYDPKRAASRIASFWDMKYFLFGREGALGGAAEDRAAFQEECHRELEAGMAYLLPGYDTFGRGLIMIRADRVPQDFDSQKRFLKVVWFCIQAASDDPRTSRNGLVYLDFKGAHFSARNMGFEFLKRAVQLYFHCAPLRVCAHHNFTSGGGRWFRAAFAPFVKWLMTSDVRMRVILHDYNETKEVLEVLEGVGIHREQIPTVLGGNLDVDEYARVWAEEQFPVVET